jgi:hypothetical protein
LRDSLLDFEDKRGPLLGAPVAKPTDDAPFLLVGHPLRHNMVREEKAATRIRHSRPLFGSNQSDLRFNYREHGGVKTDELSDETRVVKSQQQPAVVLRLWMGEWNLQHISQSERSNFNVCAPNLTCAKVFLII